VVVGAVAVKVVSAHPSIPPHGVVVAVVVVDGVVVASSQGEPKKPNPRSPPHLVVGESVDVDIGGEVYSDDAAVKLVVEVGVAVVVVDVDVEVGVVVVPVFDVVVVVVVV